MKLFPKLVGFEVTKMQIKKQLCNCANGFQQYAVMSKCILWLDIHCDWITYGNLFCFSGIDWNL